MKRYAALMAVAAGLAAAAASGAASGDELAPIAPAVLVGQPYPGAGAPAEITFINTRAEPVRVLWIDPGGVNRPYQVLAPGGEYRQSTYVTHRWLVEAAESRVPLEAFIATRAIVHGDGAPQIALIR